MEPETMIAIGGLVVAGGAAVYLYFNPSLRKAIAQHLQNDLSKHRAALVKESSEVMKTLIDDAFKEIDTHTGDWKKKYNTMLSEIGEKVATLPLPEDKKTELIDLLSKIEDVQDFENKIKEVAKGKTVDLARAVFDYLIKGEKPAEPDADVDAAIEESEPKPKKKKVKKAVPIEEEE